jgi:hypothetical protein
MQIHSVGIDLGRDYFSPGSDERGRQGAVAQEVHSEAAHHVRKAVCEGPGDRSPKKPIQTRVQLPGLAGDDLWSASVAVDRVGFNHYLEIPPLLSDGTDGFKFGGSQQIARSLRPL